MAEVPTSSTHPPLPPTTEDDRLDWLRLLRSRRVGPTTFWRLLAEHGSARAALDALPEVARAAGVADYRACPEGIAIAEMRAGSMAGARLILGCDAAWPLALHDLSDAPPALWLRGNPDLLLRPMVAMVGARNASSLGLRMARRLAGELSEAGFTVVSGLARGIDAAAHQAALAGGTVAVVAGGIDVIYPTENADLTRDIAQAGLIISEQPPGTQPQARHFPARNRIVSGLAHITVVVEAAARSGSLITARTALDQGRDVMAVPGHPLDARAAGCNMLLRDGAGLVRSAADVIEAMGALSAGTIAPPRHSVAEPAPAANPEQVTPRHSRAYSQAPSSTSSGNPGIPVSASKSATDLRDAAALHNRILARLSTAPIAEDQLIRDLAGSARQVAPALIDLELEGRITRQAGGLLSRVP